MLLEDRIKAFEEIRDVFLNFQTNNIFQECIEKAQIQNSWFLKSTHSKIFYFLEIYQDRVNPYFY